MDLENNNAEEEQKYLDESSKIIKSLIDEAGKNCENELDYVQSLTKYNWERKSEMDNVERANFAGEINTQVNVTNLGLQKLRQLRKALERPFFGKIKIKFSEGDTDDFYIGLTSILNDNDVVINDWRSPIASVFYNSKMGDTSFKAPRGVINCNLKERKQIKVQDGKIKRIIESNIHLDDDELQEVLSRGSKDKMSNIVSTIQEEQNDVIRNLKDRKILVQGCAGSGKTSVALHRLAFLLYNDNKSTSENMLIFSPSDTFSNYISNVLPELGENNVMETTFSDFANAFVNKFDRLESYTEFISKYYDGINTEEENNYYRFCFSKEYKDALDKFIKRITDSYRFNDDFSYRNETIPKEYMNQLVDLRGSRNESLQEKIDGIADYVATIIKKYVSINRSALRSKIAKDLVKPAIDPRILYNKFVESEEFIEAYGKKGKKLNAKLLGYPDLLGMLYLNFEMKGYPDNDIIHHLVIDECQDYAPLQMEMIGKMFRGATITALGDVNQTINPFFKYDSLEEMKRLLGVDTKYLELNKSYRSTKEIIDYSSDIVNNDKIVPVRTGMDVPVKFKEVSYEELFKELLSDVLKLKEQGLNRICIVTKSSKEAKAIYEGLKDLVDIEVICDNKELNGSTFVSPSYIAKGLEFDAVISYNDKENPYQEEDKYLYYVACTRAQHNLTIYNEPKVLKKVRG